MTHSMRLQLPLTVGEYTRQEHTAGALDLKSTQTKNTAKNLASSNRHTHTHTFFFATRSPVCAFAFSFRFHPKPASLFCRGLPRFSKNSRRGPVLSKRSSARPTSLK